MPLDPPAHSTPPTVPAPSTPPPPESCSETIWRRTFLAQFSNPTDREALERFGDLLYTVTVGAGYLGAGDRLFAADELDAVADEIDELAATVKEISEVPDQCEVGEENLDLCREARDWEGRLGDLAHEIPCRVREVEGKPALETDRPLTADIREADRIADRIARRLADHHPDPEVRRIYRQLVDYAEGKREGRS
jgi:hypothetical protein